MAEALDASPEKGLSNDEAKSRLKKHGANRLREAQSRSALAIFVSQFKSVVIALLAAATAISFIYGENVEGVAIAVAIALNAAIGFFTELRAVRSMEALRQLGRVISRVRRGGELREVPAEDVVPGDTVVVEGGDIVTADIRLVTASKLEADESAMTGESMPVRKSARPVEEDAPLAERSCMLYKGTALSRGSGEGIVTATGMKTELGRISELVETAEEEVTPLEKRVDALGRKLIWFTLAITAAVAVSGILAGRETFLMIETAIALAVAAIPEGLPIVATIGLGRGMWRMAKRNALVNRLSAVETLGATSVICTDKTGTLTENKMTVVRLALGGKTVEVESGNAPFRVDGHPTEVDDLPPLTEAIEVFALCNNASLGEGEESGFGDPLEVALLEAASKAGITRDELAKRLPEVREEAFDTETKKMATFHGQEDQLLVAVKGAPEEVLDVCERVRIPEGETDLDDEGRKQWSDKNEEMAGEGLRVLAVARKTVDSDQAAPYENLTFLGLVGMLDPPRADVRDALAECRRSGIRVIMVTGDQPVTARHIAAAVNLVDDQDPEVIHGKELKPLAEMTKEEKRRFLKASVFARVSPAHKLDLVDLHQKNNAIVAMTGDGVNDAPALKEADIGVAMGRRGTEVAREASDMVLKDDAFSTIVMAVEQGRAIFNNIRKFVLYLLSCNVSQILAVAIASIINAPLPILPLQILFLNLVTDVFPALALGMGEGSRDIMDHPPRDPREPIMTKTHWVAVGGYGLLIAAAALASLGLSLAWLDINENAAVTVSFLTLAFGQMFHVFNMRETGSHPIHNSVVRNPYVWGALVLSAALILLALCVPLLADALKLAPPGPKGWGIVLVFSLAPLFLGQVVKFVRDKHS